MATQNFLPYTLHEAVVLIDFHFIPGERQTFNHPGCGPSVDINRILYQGADVLPLVNPADVEAIEQWIIQQSS